jgi:riboflavin kinase/FMN adenylyltransferase
MTLRASSWLESWVYSLDGQIRGKKYHGIGVYFPERELFEAHFFDLDDDIYGEEVTITIQEKVRENKKFSSQEDLILQIEKDIVFVKTRNRKPSEIPQ